MQRIDTPNREIDKFGPGKDGFRAAVPGVSEPTYLTAKFFNAIQEALVRVIEAAGLVPADDHNQFLNALLAIADRTGNDLGAPNGSTLVGHTDALSGKTSSVARQFNRAPSAYGRVDQTMLPVLIRAMAQYRLGDPAQKPFRFATFASSIGNAPTLPHPETQAPGTDFFNRLMKALDPGGIFAYEIRNYSLDGSTVTQWNQAAGPIDTMLAEGYIPHCVYLIPGMNDFAVAQYNSGQGFSGFQKVLPEVLIRLKDVIRCDVVLTTSPHASIVNHPELNRLQPGIPQVYPTYIPSPVSDDQLQPRGDDGTMTADFTGDGVEITLSKRYFSGNKAIRSAAHKFGCPLIDAEYGWIRTLQEYKVITGSMSGAEHAVFNLGQNNHPNIVGIGGSYHDGNANFAAQIGRQAMQSGSRPLMNGYFSLNRPSDAGLLTSDPANPAVWDIAPPHGDGVTPPLIVRINAGPVDGYGAKSPMEVLRVDPLTGDLMSPAARIGGAIGRPSFLARDPSGPDEVRARQRIYNLPLGSTAASFTLPLNMCGSFSLMASQPGVAINQRWRIEFSTHTDPATQIATITMEPGYPVHIAQEQSFIVSIVGLTITATTKYAGTTMSVACDAW